MIIHRNLVQGTPQWRKARAGIPTASAFSDILTAKTMKLSSSADGYENKCVAEILLGKPIEDFGGSRATERGKELEPDAFSFYEAMFDCQLEHVGFVTNDAKTFGGSPDACQLSEDGTRIIRAVQLKCGGAKQHIGYLLKPETLYDDHKAQCQGEILVYHPEVYDIMHYYPEFPPAIFRVTKDEEYITKLSTQLDLFTANVQEKLAKIKAM